MRSFVKIWAGIALIAIGIGVTIVAITFAAGISFSDIARSSNVSIARDAFDGVVFSGATTDRSPTIVEYDDDNVTTGNENSDTFAATYQNVKAVDIDIEYGEVNIITGDTFSVDAIRLPKDGIEVSVKDGIWRIEEQGRYDIGFWNNRRAPKITITIPEDFTADYFNLVVNAGDVEVDKIVAAEGEFNVSAGRLAIDELNITNESSYTVGAGQIQLNNVAANNITANCGVGELVIKGTITGDNDITCSIGKIDMDLSGEENDYSYDVNVSIGNVTIGRESYHNVTNKIINNSNAANNFSLNCEIGNITVDFD